MPSSLATTATSGRLPDSNRRRTHFTEPMVPGLCSRALSWSSNCDASILHEFLVVGDKRKFEISDVQHQSIASTAVFDRTSEELLQSAAALLRPREFETLWIQLCHRPPTAEFNENGEHCIDHDRRTLLGHKRPGCLNVEFFPVF